MYAVAESYYVVCPGVDRETKAADGSPLMQWLFEPLPAIFPPLTIVAEPPIGSRRVEPRGIEATVDLRGVTRTRRDIFADLTLAVGAEFPEFALMNPIGGEMEIHVSSELDAEQIAALRAAVESLDEPVTFTIVHPSAPSDARSFYRPRGGDLMLLPSRAFAPDLPQKVRWLIEEDEEFWLENRREALLGKQGASAFSMLPADWQGKDLRCVVDATAFPPANIRSYLTLFETVFLALPLAEKFDEGLERLGVTASELADLLGTGRLKLLLPQSVDRYDMQWLARALDIGGENIIASRRIAGAVLADTRSRVPFLHPPLELEERRILIAALDSASKVPEIPPELRTWFQVIANESRDFWQSTPLSIQREGALQTARMGIGWLASGLHEELTGEERIIEIMGAAAAVEWAAALGAHVFPKSTETYSEEAACNLLAALSSPLDPTRVPVADPRIHKVVDDLLAIDSDMPAVEFATTFRGADIDRFRGLVAELTTWNQDESYFQQEVDRFNREVKQCESRPNRLRTMNITSLMTSVAAEAAPALPPALHAIHHLPIGVWLLGVLIGLAAEPTPKSGVVGRIWDYTNGLLARASPRSVLVSRLRQQAKTLKR